MPIICSYCRDEFCEKFAQENVGLYNDEDKEDDYIEALAAALEVEFSGHNQPIFQAISETDGPEYNLVCAHHLFYAQEGS